MVEGDATALEPAFMPATFEPAVAASDAAASVENFQGAQSLDAGAFGAEALGAEATTTAAAAFPLLYDVVLVNPPYIPSDGSPEGSLTAFGDGGHFGEELTQKVGV